MLKTGLSALRAMRTTLQLAAPSSRLRVLRLCVTAAGKGPASAAGGARKLSGSSKPAKDGRAAAAPSTTHSQQQQQQQQAAPQEHFYANELHTFASLGLNPAVCQAVEAAGFERPSRVQELAVPTILAGGSVVLAAETGSGKTLAYILPIASSLLRLRAAREDGSRNRACALVLCPNNTLCQQLVSVASRLKNPSGQPLLHTHHLNAYSPPPFDLPDVLVCTPGYLANLFSEHGLSYGSLWTEEGLSRVVGHVVVDEADILLSRAYSRAMDRIEQAFKAGERRLMEARVCQELGIDPDTFARLPRDLKVATWEGGAPGLLKAGFRPPKRVKAAAAAPAAGAADAGAAVADDDAQQGVEERRASHAAASSSNSSSSGSREGQQQYGPYRRRQWVFVAATMPSVTKGDIGTELQERFSSATWVQGDLLHQSKPKVAHTWVHTPDEAAWEGALVTALTQDPDHQGDRARVLVFTAGPDRADQVGQLLSDHGVPHVVFHKNIQVPNKDTLLQEAFQQQEDSGNVVVVTTDAMARGVDLPAISHVIQADFASTATDFLHRIGRTARAASGGKVTSLYRPAQQVLAETLQQYIEQGRPVEDCFSRNRSFSKKLKKFGKFVPRGQGGAPIEEGGGGGKVGGRSGGGSSSSSNGRAKQGRP